MMRRLAVVATVIALVLGFSASPAAAAGPSGSALWAGYVGFWEHQNFGGVASKYYFPANGVCINLPAGTGYVGGKVTSLWSRAPGKVIDAWEETGCPGGIFDGPIVNFGYEKGSSKLPSLSNDRIRSFRARAA